MTDESGGRDVTTRVPAATDSQHLTRLCDVAADANAAAPARPSTLQPTFAPKQIAFHKTTIALIDACTECLNSDTFRTRRPPTNRQTVSCSQSQCVVRLRFRCNTSSVGAYFISISFAALPPTEGHIPRAAT